MNRASLKSRFLALLIDYAIIGIILFVLIPFMRSIIYSDFIKTTMIIIGLNVLFFLKDSTSQSLGKKIMKIRIVNKENLKKPNIFLPFIRNLFLCLGIIEIIVILSSKENERLGDKATNTIVVNAV